MYWITASNVIRSLLQGGYTKVNIDEAIEMVGLVRHIAYKNCSLQYTVTQHTCIHSSTQWCGLHILHMVISMVTGPAGNRLGGAAATVAENW